MLLVARTPSNQRATKFYLATPFSRIRPFRTSRLERLHRRSFLGREEVRQLLDGACQVVQPAV
jgi:hypothetical protein